VPTPSQADNILCPGVACVGSDNADIIVGTPVGDEIDGLMGNDVIFGLGDFDLIGGNEGNDLIFGGQGDDVQGGDDGNDVLFPGPDTDINSFQNANGDDGNDTINVLVGEITGCLVIEDDGGLDTVNLIGFGAYSLTAPFGLPEDLGPGFIAEIDPVSGGFIVIEIDTNSDDGIETVNGFVSPAIIQGGEVPDSCNFG
jgi:hypothetical protein